MSKPLITFLIPVYNGANLIEAAIDSVLNQPCKDLELYIIDDGSTDSTLSICRNYEANDKRVKVLTHPNVGLGKNRNLAIPFLSGDWVIFLDHDDVVHPSFFNNDFLILLEKCSEQKIDVIVPSRVKADYALSKGIVEKVPELGIVNGGNFASWKIDYEFATLIYKNDLIQSNRLFFEETKPEMESIFRHKAAYLAYKLLFTNNFYFAIRRDTPTSITHNWKFREVSKIRYNGYENLRNWHVSINPHDQEVERHCNDILSDILFEYINLNSPIFNVRKFKKILKSWNLSRLVNDTSNLSEMNRKKIYFFSNYFTLFICLNNLKELIKKIDQGFRRRKECPDFSIPYMDIINIPFDYKSCL